MVTLERLRVTIGIALTDQFAQPGPPLATRVGTLARTREALHNNWNKNDPKDAQVALNMMKIGSEQFYHDPLVRGTNDIQELSKTHDIVSKSKAVLWHRILTHYLLLYFPEADRFHRFSRGDWFFTFLKSYQSPHFITAYAKKIILLNTFKFGGYYPGSLCLSSANNTQKRPRQQCSFNP